MDKKTFFKIIITIFMCTILNSEIYASWYEEPEVFETEDIDSKWWLSRKKKEKLKVEQEKEISKKIEENKNKPFKDKSIKWLYNDLDITIFPKDKWEIIDDDNDGIGYNYYFDKDGFLLIDTITPDYKIVDSQGREVDINSHPIKYEMKDVINITVKEEGIVLDEDYTYIAPTKEPSKVLIGEGVVLRKKEKIFDNTIEKDVLLYVDSSDRFIKDTKGTIYNEVRWEKCSSLKGNGGYVVFNNPQNNFNKITGYISTEYFTYDDNTDLTLKVYDADLYDKLKEEHHLYDIEEIYKDDSFNKTDAIRFSFTFDRSIKRLRFEIEVDGEYKNRTCFIKDLKYGFNKKAFYNELIRKKEEEEEIENLKRLGIYVEDMWSFDAIDEDGNEIEEYDDEEIETENENNDDRIGGKAYEFDEETISYEDIIRDRNTGPAFDESLRNIKEIGPGFINISSSSYIK